MFLSNYTKSRYRVVNRRKFVISTIIVLALFATSVYYGVLGAKAVYGFVAGYFKNEVIEARGNVEEEPTATPFVFSYGDTEIVAEEESEFIDKLTQTLQKTMTESTTEINTLKVRVQTVSYQNTELQKQNHEYEKELEDKQLALKLEKENERIKTEYAYALNRKGSDVTIEDIKMIEKISAEYGGLVHPHLWLAMIDLESGFNSKAKSKTSTATGWGQILAGTGKSIYEKELKLGRYNHSMAYNKETNARMSIYYLSKHIKTYNGNISAALQRYNGSELGAKYYTIIAAKLKTNTGLTLKQVQTSTKGEPV